jgi:hypothetical protein
MLGSLQDVAGMRGRAGALALAMLIGTGCGKVDTGNPGGDGELRDGAAAADGSAPADAAAPDASVRVADSVRDFAETQGAGGWQYLYAQPGSELAEMVHADGLWFVDHNLYWTQLWDSGGHPNVGGRVVEGPVVVQQPVRRWTSDLAGSATIAYAAARIHDGPCGDGVAVRVIVDDEVAWEYTLPGEADMTPVEGTLSTTLAQGSTVDLVLDPLTGDGCDGTYFTAIITVTGAD